MNRNLYRTGSIALITVLLSCTTFAQEQAAGLTSSRPKKSLTLKEALQLSLQNNKQLKLSAAKVDEACANHKEAWNNHLPDAKISGSYLRIANPDVSLKVKLGSGGSGSSSVGGGVKVDQAAYAMANVTMPVFGGFRVKYGAESAKYLEMAARLDADNDREEVIQNTINAYSNLYKSFKTIELVKENLKQQEARITDFTNLEKNGVLAHNDVLKAQLQQSNIELSLLDAENNYTITCANISLMLGLEDNTEILPDGESISNNGDAGNLATWQTSALKNRKDIGALSSRENAAGFAVKATKGEYLPGLAVTGGYFAVDVPNFVTVTNAFNLGIGLQYNIASIWKTGAKVDAATARLHQLQAAKDIMTERMSLQVNQAYQNYLLAMRKINVYKKAVDQSRENFRITKNKHDNALVTATELLEADVAQFQANLNYAFSTIDASVAYSKLQQASGTLLESYQKNK